LCLGHRRARRGWRGEDEHCQRRTRCRAHAPEHPGAHDDVRRRRRRRRHRSSGVRVRTTAVGISRGACVMAENVWIVGAAMTKFGRYPDKDVLDLSSDAALDAMADADTTIHDMNVMAV